MEGILPKVSGGTLSVRMKIGVKNDVKHGKETGDVNVKWEVIAV